MSDVKYVAESKEFIIDGKVVKESTLTEQEKQILMEQCINVQLLVGSNNQSNGQLIV